MRHGFTLIELLLSIGIIAVLAAIVIMAINPGRQLTLAGDAERRSNVNQLQKAVMQYQIEEGEMPGDLSIPIGQGNAIPICRSSYADPTCINMDLLVPDYVACLPRDGAETNDLFTGYRIYRQSGRALVESVHLGMSGKGSCEARPDPIAYWNLDEGSGLVAVDSSSYGRDGALSNMEEVDWVTDVPGTHFDNPYALDFDGNDEYVDVGNFNVTGDQLTLSAWFKTRTPVGYDPRILSKADGWMSGQSYWQIALDDGSPDEMRFRIYTTSGGEERIDSGSVTHNVWTHLAGVYDGQIMRLYENGTSLGTLAKSGTLRTGAGSVWIGGNPPGPTDRPFDGLIDDVRIYDQALDAAQIFSLASGNP